MNKQILDKAIEEIYRLFSPSGSVPKEKEIRDVFKWIYKLGKQDKD